MRDYRQAAIEAFHRINNKEDFHFSKFQEFDKKYHQKLDAGDYDSTEANAYRLTKEYHLGKFKAYRESRELLWEELNNAPDIVPVEQKPAKQLDLTEYQKTKT